MGEQEFCFVFFVGSFFSSFMPLLLLAVVSYVMGAKINCELRHISTKTKKNKNLNPAQTPIPIPQFPSVVHEFDGHPEAGGAVGPRPSGLLRPRLQLV